MDCIFCKIIEGEIPSDTVYEDEEITAFRDINPQAPVHIVIIPKKHIAALSDLSESESALVGRMVAVANKLAKKEGVADKGYRVVINWGGGYQTKSADFWYSKKASSPAMLLASTMAPEAIRPVTSFRETCTKVMLSLSSALRGLGTKSVAR